jgi:hypothetical protein
MESGLLHTLMARYEAEGVAPDGDIHRGEYNPECWSRVGAVRFVLKCRRLSRGGIKVLNCFAKNLFGY